MAKLIDCHRCTLADFINLAESTSDNGGLAIIFVNQNNKLSLYHVLDHENTGENSKLLDQIDCVCYKNPSSYTTTWSRYQNIVNQGNRAIYRLLLNTEYYCSCIKTKMLLAIAMIEKLGMHETIQRFNRVFQYTNMNYPLTRNQVVDLLND